ncbi:carbohydrate kinase family protein [Patescibacteria group bacterium]
MLDILTIGDIKLDTFVVLDDASVQCQLKMPDCQLCMEYGAKIDVDIVDSQIAGSAPNVATGLSRMKQKTAVVAPMGQDSTRPLALEVLKKEKVGTQFVHVIKNEQSSYSVVLNFKGEKTILTSHIEHDYQLPKNLTKTNWVYVCEMGGGYEKLYQQLNQCSVKVCNHLALNPGSIQIKERKKELLKLLKSTEILFVNRGEAQDLAQTQKDDVLHLSAKLHRMGAKTVVITDGANGAHGFDGQKLFYCPIFPAKLIEATGAGDAFATGFLGAIINKQPIDQALKWGAVNSASVIQYVGPTKGLLTISKIKKQLKERPSFKTKEV